MPISWGSDLATQQAAISQINTELAALKTNHYQIKNGQPAVEDTRTLFFDPSLKQFVGGYASKLPLFPIYPYYTKFVSQGTFTNGVRTTWTIDYNPDLDSLHFVFVTKATISGPVTCNLESTNTGWSAGTGTYETVAFAGLTTTSTTAIQFPCTGSNHSWYTYVDVELKNINNCTNNAGLVSMKTIRPANPDHANLTNLKAYKTVGDFTVTTPPVTQLQMSRTDLIGWWFLWRSV